MLELDTALVHAPAASTAAIITLAAPDPISPGRRWSIGGLAWSYDSDPDDGANLLIENGGVAAFKVYITVAGPGFIGFSDPLKCAPNAEVVVTLSDGGAAVTGTVNVLGAKLVD